MSSACAGGAAAAGEFLPSRKRSGTAFREPRGKASKMKIFAELLGRLEGTMQVVKDQLTEMDGEQLDALVQSLGPKSSIGSAEMVLTVLAFREIEARNRARA